jgi:hypothetical protein
MGKRDCRDTEKFWHDEERLFGITFLKMGKEIVGFGYSV